MSPAGLIPTDSYYKKPNEHMCHLVETILKRTHPGVIVEKLDWALRVSWEGLIVIRPLGKTEITMDIIHSFKQYLDEQLRVRYIQNKGHRNMWGLRAF